MNSNVINSQSDKISDYSSTIENNNRIVEDLYKVFPVKSYNSWNNKKIKSDFELYSLDELIVKLETNNGYHERLSKEGTYIFFGDCD